MERYYPAKRFDASFLLGDDRAMLHYLHDLQRSNPNDFLPDEASRAEYLTAALETGDVDLVARARADIRQARQAESRAAVAQRAGYDYSNVLPLRGWGVR